MTSPNPVTLRTTDGLELEAELHRPDGDVVGAVALAHPHPGYGGDMHAGLVGLLPDLLAPRGIVVLRWNFRGVGRSDGSQGDGVDETHDVVAALDHLHALGLGVPTVLAGWSFGADVSLAVDDDRHDGWVAIAAPLAYAGDAPAAGSDDRPKLLLVPEHDQFRAPAAAAEATATWPSTTIVTIPGSDHFLGGRSAMVADQLADRFGP